MLQTSRAGSDRLGEACRRAGIPPERRPQAKDWRRLLIRQTESGTETARLSWPLGEMAYAGDLKSLASNGFPVRVREGLPSETLGQSAIQMAKALRLSRLSRARSPAAVPTHRKSGARGLGADVVALALAASRRASRHFAARCALRLLTADPATREPSLRCVARSTSDRRPRDARVRFAAGARLSF
jgi:hypothetical protein